MCKHGLVNLFHLLFVAPLLLYIGLRRDKCHKMYFNLLVLLGLAVFAYHTYRYLTSPSDSNYNDSNNHNNNYVYNNISSIETEVGNSNNVEMEVIDVENTSTPEMFEPAFESTSSGDSMNDVEGFTW